MPDGDTERFYCPTCRKKYRWKPELAGRKVKCAACGSKLRVPAAAGGHADLLEPPPPPPEAEPDLGDMYELDLPAEPAPKAASAAQGAGGDGKCPNCNTPVKSNAVLCMNCGFNFAEGKVMQTIVGGGGGGAAPASGAPLTDKSGRPIGGALAHMGHSSVVAQAVESGEDAQGSNALKDLWLPLGLIILGLGFNTIQQLFFIPDVTVGLVAAVITVFVDLAISIPLLLIAMILAVKLFDMTFGNLGQALLKMVAVILGPSAIGGIISVLLGGGLVGFFVGDIMIAFILFWILLAVLFDLEGLEALYLIFILWLVQYGAALLVGAIALSFMF